MMLKPVRGNSGESPSDRTIHSTHVMQFCFDPSEASRSSKKVRIPVFTMHADVVFLFKSLVLSYIPDERKITRC